MNGPKIDPIPALLQELSRQTDPAAALRLLEDAVRRLPPDPRLMLLLAGHRMSSQDVDGAEAAFTAALQMAFDFHIARFQLGLLQLTSGRVQTAFVTWGPLDRLPEDAYLRLFRDGLVKVAQNRFEEAERLLRAGMERNSENAPLNRDIQMVIGRMPRTGTDGGGPSPTEETAQPMANGHFLVSSYGKSR